MSRPEIHEVPDYNSDSYYYSVDEENSDGGSDAELADFIVADDGPKPDVSPNKPRTKPTQTHENAPPNTAQSKFANLGTHQTQKIPPTARLLRAHIAVLASALGGPDHAASTPIYKLGHDALACLKDIKRWLRAVDEKNASFDVALACAECDLVRSDLTVILCQWDRPAAGISRPRNIDRIMLACLELLVLLTWPAEISRRASVAEFTAKTSNRRAQLVYKHHILTYRQGHTIKAVLRMGLAALKTPRMEREPRDTNILRLILFFLRNVLSIEPLAAAKTPKAVSNASSMPHGISVDEIALSAVVQAFERNNAMLFLASVAHAAHAELRDEGFALLVMECVSLLTKGVRASELVEKTTSLASPASRVAPATAVAGMDLKALLGEESRRRKQANNTVSTRHGRFGTLLSIRNAANASYYAVSGQKALASTFDSLQKLDATKTWRRPAAFKHDANAYVKNEMVVLGVKSAEILAKFVDSLLLSGAYNTMLEFVGRHVTNLANDRDTTGHGLLAAVDPMELAAYFHTVAWFFRYKRERTQYFLDQGKTPAQDADGLDYGSVGAALSEVNFILLISYVRSAFETRDWDSLHVAMVCFREMLWIAHTIFSQSQKKDSSQSGLDDAGLEDRELAEGIVRKLFAQKQFLDLCVKIPRNAARHSPEYLGVVVSVVHVLLKSFEALANEDVRLFIRTRRRMRRMGKRSGLNREMDRQHAHLIEGNGSENENENENENGSENEDNEEEIRYITQERQLDFKSTEASFFHPATVDAHIEYLAKYEDLDAGEIKRVLSYFHRLFVVRKDHSALFRLDFMLLLYRLRTHLRSTSGSSGGASGGSSGPASSSSSVGRHVDDFVVYFMKKFKTALGRFPTAIEVLFPRLETTEISRFLSTGDVELAVPKKDKSSSGRGAKNSYFDEDAVQPRAAPLLQFIDAEKSLDDKIGVCVYHLMKKKNTAAFLRFFAAELLRLSEIFTSEETPQSVKLNLKLNLNLGNRRLLISDPHLRLLLESIGFRLPYLQNDETTLISSVTADTLVQARESVLKWTEMHTAGVGDREPFLDQTQRVLLSSAQLAFGRESLENLRDGIDFDSEKAHELELDERLQNTVVGLAKRREYDESVSSQFYADDDFVDPPSGDESGSDNNNNGGGDDDNDSSHVTERNKKSRIRRRRRVDSEDDEDGTRSLSSASEGEEEVPQKRRRRTKKARSEAVAAPVPERSTRSAEMVHDSDDDSDDERNAAFFEKEEKLRQLISSTGGIASRVQLELFKESWSAILKNGGNTDQVNAALEAASGLFVGADDDDDENGEEFPNLAPAQDSQNSSRIATPEPSADSASEIEDGEEEKEESERAASRKRRRVIDDEDDE